jgi:NTE family protein
MSETSVAIACQGGGSHTAFTAGVLQRILPEIETGPYDLLAMSGTSGGAITALAAWDRLLDGDASAAAENVQSLWDDIAASDVVDRTLNDWAVWGTHVQNNGAPVPRFSPYDLPLADVGRRTLRRTIERHVDFETLAQRHDETSPHMVVGSVDITDGDFVTFEDEELRVEHALASAAVPNLFEAVEIDGHYHWDGLFSQNPPVRELFSIDPRRKPDELWVVQINPQHRDEEPKTMEAIADRRNELSGNISLNEELHFVEKVNEWVDEGRLDDTYTHTDIKRVTLDRELPHSTKLDREVDFIEELMSAGRECGGTLLE